MFVALLRFIIDVDPMQHFFAAVARVSEAILFASWSPCVVRVSAVVAAFLKYFVQPFAHAMGLALELCISPLAHHFVLATFAHSIAALFGMTSK